MDGNSNNKVVCCFCGEELFIEEATILIIQPNIKSEERQYLYCHKNHLVERIVKFIPLHPDLLEDNDSVDDKISK